MENTKLLGRWGENKAAEYLKSKGYELVGLNYATRFGEIDIIAKNEYCIVFVEVKLRKDKRFAEAREFVDEKKRCRIVTCAGQWIIENETGLQPRFDVIEVYAPDGYFTKSPEIHHIINAFSAGEK